MPHRPRSSVMTHSLRSPRLRQDLPLAHEPPSPRRLGNYSSGGRFLPGRGGSLEQGIGPPSGRASGQGLLSGAGYRPGSRQGSAQGSRAKYIFAREPERAARRAAEIAYLREFAGSSLKGGLSPPPMPSGTGVSVVGGVAPRLNRPKSASRLPSQRTRPLVRESS